MYRNEDVALNELTKLDSIGSECIRRKGRVAPIVSLAFGGLCMCGEDM